MRMLALFVAFAINFILLFYKVTVPRMFLSLHSAHLLLQSVVLHAMVSNYTVQLLKAHDTRDFTAYGHLKNFFVLWAFAVESLTLA